MQYKILLADSEPNILEFLEYNLLKEGFRVILTTSKSEVFKKLNEKPDMIVINVDLQNGDTFELCQRIRNEIGFEKTPILLLTSQANEIDEIDSLEAGANDVISIPVSSKKFIARIKSNLRKVKVEDSESLPKKIKIGNLEIDREKFIIIIDNKEISLPRREFELLFFLARQPGHVFNRDTILYKVWGSDIRVVDRTIDVHIRKIRGRLGELKHYIKTIKGVGYTLKV